MARLVGAEGREEEIKCCRFHVSQSLDWSALIFTVDESQEGKCTQKECWAEQIAQRRQIWNRGCVRIDFVFPHRMDDHVGDEQKQDNLARRNFVLKLGKLIKRRSTHLNKANSHIRKYKWSTNGWARHVNVVSHVNEQNLTGNWHHNQNAGRLGVRRAVEERSPWHLEDLRVGRNDAGKWALVEHGWDLARLHRDEVASDSINDWLKDDEARELSDRSL